MSNYYVKYIPVEEPETELAPSQTAILCEADDPDAKLVVVHEVEGEEGLPENFDIDID